MNIIEHEGNLVRERIYEGVLSNGLRIYYLPKKGFTKQYAMFATNFGANDLIFKSTLDNKEHCVSEGIAHFLEHKMFEEPEGNAFDKFASNGASSNAYTNFNITAYYFTSTDYFYENLKHLIGFVQNPYFTDENVEKEKGIIEQEIKMYEDTPDWKVYFNLLKAMYHNHPVKNEIIGTVKSIYGISKEELYTCYNTFYHPSNMALIVIGDLDKDRVFQTVEKYYEENKLIGEINIERIYPEEPISVKDSIIKDRMDISLPLFYIGYKDKELKLRGMELLRKEVEIRILADMIFGNSYELYEKLYKKGLIDNSFGWDYAAHTDYGHVIIGGQSNNPEEIVSIVNEYIDNLRNQGLSEEAFNRVKKRQIGQYLGYFNSIEFLGSSFISYIFKDINFMEYIDVLKNATFAEIENRFSKYFNKESQAVSILNTNKKN